MANELFTNLESSEYGSKPIRLYMFSRGLDVYRWCSADRDIIMGGNTFYTIKGGISDSGVNQTGDDSPDDLVITVAGNNAIAQLYRGFPPSTGVTLTVYYGHYNQNDWIVIWTGEVRSVKWPSIAVAEITCSRYTKRMHTTGLRLYWTRSCQYALYSDLCGVDRTAFAFTTTVESYDGETLVCTNLSSQEDGWWLNGMVSWVVEGGVAVEYRGIWSHSGDSISVFGGTDGVHIGMEVTVYAGCSQTVETCKNKFNNLANYGGVPAMSGKSPFDGNSYY